MTEGQHSPLAGYDGLSHETLKKLEVDDFSTLLKFPPPQRMQLNDVGCEELYERTKLFLSLWVGLTLEVEKYKAMDPLGHSRSYTWSKLLLVAGSYYDYLLTKFLEEDRTETELPPGFRIADMKRYVAEQSVLLSKNPAVFRVNACFMLSRYIQCRMSTYFASLLGDTPVSRERTAVFEAQAHSALADLHKTTSRCRLTPLRTLGNILVLGASDGLTRVYERMSQGWESAQRQGLFSLLAPGDLPKLAARSRACIDKHGEKGVETVFEQQLLLLFRSFGFQAVPAPRASRRIDLICVSDVPASKVTVLVEAKTSSRNYALPVSDSRAIREYVRHTSRALSALPGLGLVLLVGPTPASTIRPKIETLSRGCGVPCVYCSAEVLATLRELVVEPIPASSFVDAMISGGPVISVQSVESLAASLGEQTKAYGEFIGQMLALREAYED